MSQNDKSAAAPAANRFGTFGGVFTPCVLTILGVIMFLRFGEVVANAGILHALLIVVCAKAITLLTGLSLSAIATNTRTKGGGAYFLISRSLGVEFGGTIGTVFFLAQAISVAMYIVGFAEAFTATFGGSLPGVATITNAFVFVCVFIGAGWTIKVQYGILAVLLAALVSFYVGAIGQFSPDLLAANRDAQYVTGQDWVTMFALFFPAVTGIMAGANMSGDLKDPAVAIPRGTLWAIVFTGLIYLTLALMLGATRSREAMLGDNLIMADVAVVGWLITAGVFAATLSSALGSMMGAPRILQAFARDRVLPVLRPFAQAGEPRRAIILTAGISQACIMLGDLNAIAPIITMAFMITYGTLNLATFYESFTGNPSYRPRFRLNHWVLSLLGAISCMGVMFLISWVWAAVAVAGMVGLYWLINQREIEANWGDIRSGLAFERARRNLALLEDRLYHPKNWRPMLLTLTGAADIRPYLAVYGHWLTAGHGIQTLGQVIEGELPAMLQRRANQKDVLRTFVHDNDIIAFPAVVVAESTQEGIVSLVQAHGLGGLEPNTVMLGWPRHLEQRGAALCRLLRMMDGLKRSVAIVRSAHGDESVWVAPPGTIDVWWRGRNNGPLLLLLAHLLRKNVGWRNRTIRLMRVVDKEAARAEVARHLSALAHDSRIEAQVRVFVGDNAVDVIHRESRAAAVTILGFEPPADESCDDRFLAGIDRLTASLDRVILVDSAGGMELES